MLHEVRALVLYNYYGFAIFYKCDIIYDTTVAD